MRTHRNLSFRPPTDRSFKHNKGLFRFDSLSSFLRTITAMSARTSWVSTLPNQLHPPSPSVNTRRNVIPVVSCKACSRDETSLAETECFKRRLILIGGLALASTTIPTSSSSADVPDKYRAFVDKIDGYSYYYPADWRDFDFLGHDSAFKDRNVSLQHVRVGFIPINKADIGDLGQLEEVIPELVKNVYAAPNQFPTIFDMHEWSADGKNYWTVEYELESPNFARTAFATLGIGNGRYYTLTVGANERRWKRVRNKLKVVADSFRILDI